MILEQIASDTRERVDAKKRTFSLPQLREQAEKMTGETGFQFCKSLRQPGLSVICEVKKASPSKGMIAEAFPYVEIAKEYEAAGAAAVSVLTEPHFFLGSDAYLREIRQAVQIPLLRKDFTIDEYQIYEAKTLGADAVLLICSLLGENQLASYLALAHSLGMDALVEAHDCGEIQCALRAGADIIGVNNRNLRDFSVNVQNSLALRNFVPPDTVFVAESGIQSGADTRILREAGVDAVLVGETMMKSPQKAALLAEFRGIGYE
jgi:indole-3-glycerol phosphate synthase